jgi:peroxiredoxin
VYTQDETSRERLREKCQFDFSLPADTERAAAKAYGTVACGGLLFSAKARIGIADRVTFIIDKKDKIANIVDKPDTGDHAEAVLALLLTLDPIWAGIAGQKCAIMYLTNAN